MQGCIGEEEMCTSHTMHKHQVPHHPIGPHDHKKPKRSNPLRSRVVFVRQVSLFRFVSPNEFTKRTSSLSFRENANVVTLTQFCGPSYSPRVFKCKRIWTVEVGEYAARVLKNPKLLKCKSLEKLGVEAGVDLNTTALLDSGGRAKRPSPKWGSKLFFEEEVVSIMYDAVGCYLIVQKLLAS
ncbi:unnamed protein product [Cuscuta campestris]|uniref:Uncharacterized protein n=1 Tax=Cuscuta campestris TaxID=132261 RepID=A0A484NFY8_9ASTE|nr:unnamed protein product [Cuscuta campestris]